MWQLGSNNAAGTGLSSGFPSAAGTGYAVGDLITLTGGTATQQAILKVTQLTSGGSGVSQAVVVNPGVYSVVPSNPVSQGSTTGGGASATFTFTQMLNSQIALTTSGHDHFINQFWSEFGNIGIAGSGGSDYILPTLFPIGASTGIYFTGCEQVRIGILQCDTNSYVGTDINGCNCLTIASGNYFAVNGTSATAGFTCGQDTITANANLDITFNGQRGVAMVPGLMRMLIAASSSIFVMTQFFPVVA